MEALTYAKTSRYVEDLGPDEYKGWRPKQLMQRILEIDPFADSPVSLQVEVRENEPNGRLSFKEIASDTPISFKHLKDHYDALGSYLHAPTIKNLELKGWHDLVRMRERCASLLEMLRNAVESNWTLRFSTTISFDCDNCGRAVRRHLDQSVECREITCWHCKASYQVSHVDDQQTERIANVHMVSCANKECGKKMPIWQNDLKYGAEFVCTTCGSKTMIAYSILLIES